MRTAKMELDDSTAIENQLWHLHPRFSREAQTIAAALLLLPALNQIIAITTTRTAAAKTHPPAIICATLAVLALGPLLPPGQGAEEEKSHSRIDTAGLVLILAFSVCRIGDPEFPRLGFIGTNAADKVLVDLRNFMH